MILEEHTARIQKADGTLGKKVYKWEVPHDVVILARKHKKKIVALGRWKNEPPQDKRFICIALPGSSIPAYFEYDEVKIMLESLKKDI